ncbi:DEAD/DEAH box helicase [Candidatus Poribacteria bacterium]|nr:DEAD/DEAH box helicase [Candidatus Poribacteria bacterium]MYG05043.1 DEAD/DEAH box helicase [Candidatus Poribacteria bacterium]MYK24408.1 DEAD/DEAH box helicase [Candidatus Poribacteria bacterium]
MPKLNLKPSHKAIWDFYGTLQQYEQHAVRHEGAVSSPFETLLHTCAKQVNATLVPQYAIRAAAGNRIVVDGVILDAYGLPFAYWEAKDMDDDLPKAVQAKRDKGYPLDNILFQTPQRAILYQNGQIALDLDITEPARLIAALQYLFAYVPPALDNWQTAVSDFRAYVPDLAQALKARIEQRHEADSAFKEAFTGFYETCRTSINPDLSRDAVEEMLIQHILTERIFRTIFERSDFTSRNTIAVEIEKVSAALMRHAMSRDAFLKPLDRFYVAIEQAATLCRDFSQKQHFLNTFYEKFFQGFSEDVADTHGVVYTPQPIVDFMVNSVAHILETEFGRSLSDSGVHIIDPFVGTGNFIVRLIQDIRGTALAEKYRHELHCNEVMLLPYYIASLNIEQEFFERTAEYLPFEGIALADTFELLEQQQTELFTRENAERVERQKAADMFVVIGNPPYNTQQINENDNNKNRKYPTMDKRIEETYVQDSAAQLKSKLYDPYMKAFSWASKRIGNEGVVAFVTNNSFLDGTAFDGMRKHLAQDFTKIYHIDLKGNARTSGERRRKEGGNVFDDQIRVGVGISFFVKKATATSASAEVWLYSVDDYLKAREKQKLLTDFGDYTNVPMKQTTIDKKYTWLTEGLRSEFDTFIPMGSEASKKGEGDAAGTLFKSYSVGVVTARDAWVYNFNQNALTENLIQMMEYYNGQMFQWERRKNRDINVNDFIDTDDTKIKWTRSLKSKFKTGTLAEFSDENVRTSLYRPFTKSHLYFHRMMNECVYVFPSIFPASDTEAENRAICVSSPRANTSFHTLMVNAIPDFHFTGDSQCFPFYTYNEDGTNRQENITDWALAAFRAYYSDEAITKWDIFHYTYALLHHPDYCEKYQANLKRDLPHIPFAEDFWGFAKAGAALADLHVNYESCPKSDELEERETEGMQVDWQVEKMKLSKDKTQLKYNDFLTLDGIPAKVYDYRLGTRSALEWVVDQYRVKMDRRSGIKNDPNREAEPRYMVDLIGQVVYVSLKTVEIVKNLPAL